MFFKPQPGLGLQCPICADLLLSIVCQTKQDIMNSEGNQKIVCYIGSSLNREIFSEVFFIMLRQVCIGPLSLT